MKVNQRQLADVLGITVQAIQKMQEEGLPIENKFRTGRKTNEYDTGDVIKWIIARIKAKNLSPLQEERTRLIKLQADKIDKHLSILNLQLLPQELMIELWGAVIEISKREIVSIPSSIKNQLPGVDNKTIKFIDDKIKESLNKLDQTRKLPTDLRKKLILWIKEVEDSA